MQSKDFRIAKVSLLISILFFVMTATSIAQQAISKLKPPSRRISFADAQRILAGEEEGNLSKQPNKFTRTRLSNGQLLEVYYPITAPGRRAGRSKTLTAPGYGVLYDSEAAFKDATRPRHMLEDLIPDGRDLVGNIPQLVTRLEKRLGMGAGKLDYSRASLRPIDAYIAGFHSSYTTAQTNPKLFQELTAYYGETLRRALNGEWKIREERVGGTHIQAEPNISTKVGGRIKEIKPWSSIISTLYDEEKRGMGLTKVYDADLAAAR